MDRAHRCALIIALLAQTVGLGACASNTIGTAPPPAPETQPYRIGPPDRLDITVLPDPAISRQVTVRPDGMISIDLVGDIPAAGRTAEEVARDIQTRISRYKRDASVTVALVSALSTEITVLGEVGSQRTFPLSRQTRLIEAIGQVGGIGQRADKSNVRLIRLIDGKTHILYADVEAIENGDLSTNYLLLGGDVIIVPPTGLASTGYAIQSVLFPFQALLGFGTNITTRVIRGGY